MLNLIIYPLLLWRTLLLCHTRSTHMPRATPCASVSMCIVMSVQSMCCWFSRNPLAKDSTKLNWRWISNCDCISDTSFWAWVQIDIPKRDQHVCMYVRTYIPPENRSLIQSLVLMRSVISICHIILWQRMGVFLLCFFLAVEQIIKRTWKPRTQASGGRVRGYTHLALHIDTVRHGAESSYSSLFNHAARIQLLQIM